MKLIGLSGTNGSGKDTVGHFLAGQYDYLFISVSDLLRTECHHRALEVTRENLRMISSEWRREFGVGVLVTKAYEAYQDVSDKYAGVIASPMRNVGEAQHLKDLGGTLIWVDADPELRYKRITSADRGRAGEDNKTYDQFRQEEQDEMYPADPNDPSLLNGAGVRELADIQLLNNTTLATLETATVNALSLPPMLV